MKPSTNTDISADKIESTTPSNISKLTKSNKSSTTTNEQSTMSSKTPEVLSQKEGSHDRTPFKSNIATANSIPTQSRIESTNTVFTTKQKSENNIDVIYSF